MSSIGSFFTSFQNLFTSQSDQNANSKTVSTNPQSQENTQKSNPERDNLINNIADYNKNAYDKYNEKRQNAFKNAENIIITEGLTNIGHVLSLPHHADPSGKVNSQIKQMLGVVDILPINYYIDLSKLGKGYAIAYEYETAKTKYSESCIRYGLKASSGLRLWLTDDTASSETFSSQYNENVLMQMFNTLENYGRNLTQYSQSFGSQNYMNITSEAISEYLKGGVTGADNFLKSKMGVSNDSWFGKLFDSGAGLINSGIDIAFKGHHVSLPKIWIDSNYSPDLSLTLKLVSPYGTPEAITKYIVKPLVYILLLCSSRSSDGISYGPTQPVQVRAYGISNLNLASMNLVSIRRGGRDTAYNKFKQPLQLDITIGVTSLCSGFASIDGQAQDFKVDDSLLSFDASPGLSSGISTVGNIIRSLSPAPNEAVNKFSDPNGKSDLGKMTSENRIVSTDSNTQSVKDANKLAQQGTQSNPNGPTDTKNSPKVMLAKSHKSFEDMQATGFEVAENIGLT